MPAYVILAGVLLTGFCGIPGRSLGSESFAEFLNRVERRDPKTKAICEVRIVDERNVTLTLLNPKVVVKDDIATFEFSRDFKDKDREARFQFQVTDEVSLEVKRVMNYQEVRSLEAKAHAAIHAYRVFVASDFRIRLGDTLANADIQMGIPRKERPYGGQWGAISIYEYDDGLIIECVGRVVRDVWRDASAQLISPNGNPPLNLIPVEIASDIPPKLKGDASLAFDRLDIYFDGGSRGAEFNREDGGKLMLFFPHPGYWTPTARKNRTQPVAVLTHRNDKQMLVEIKLDSPLNRRIVELIEADISAGKHSPDKLQTLNRVRDSVRTRIPLKEIADRMDAGAAKTNLGGDPFSGGDPFD